MDTERNGTMTKEMIEKLTKKYENLFSSEKDRENFKNYLIGKYVK